MENALYTAEAVSSGGREGRVRTPDGALDLPLSMPRELGGLGKPGTTNPEQLFAAGYAACFENAIRRVAPPWPRSWSGRRTRRSAPTRGRRAATST